jgi:hypothetical protein
MLQKQVNEPVRIISKQIKADTYQWSESTLTHIEDELLVAGQVVPAGYYRRVDVPWGGTIKVAEGDRLPASLDGHVAVYECAPQRPFFSCPSNSAN